MNQPSASILITRPTGQQQTLQADCEKLGLLVKHLPCLAIKKIESVNLTKELLGQADTVLFTSRNAVEHAHELLPMPWIESTVHAIGPATQAALSSIKQAINLPPKAPFNSEAYLEQVLAQAPQHLLIIKGEGGRDLIQRTLEKREWTISLCDVYRRTLPVIEPEQIDALLAQPLPDIVSVTSNETLINLKTLSAHHWSRLLALPLVVNSQRTLELATSMGFSNNIMVANEAGNAGQTEKINQWLNARS